MLTLQGLLQGLAQWMPVVQGLVFIVTVLLLPRGIAGTAGMLRRRRQLQGGAPAAQAATAGGPAAARAPAPTPGAAS
jgi:hypothetical protein